MKSLLNLIYLGLRNIYYYVFLLIFSIFKIDDKKIVIINFNGKGYWDMWKYICNELLKYKNKYKIYWPTTTKFKDSLPESVIYIRFWSIKYLYHLATAKIRINNWRFSIWIRKRKEQFYIQTWHGCIWIKKVEAALWKNLWYFSILSAKNDSKMADLFISNSVFCTNNYKDNFWYNGNILEIWCPRNDIIINNDKLSISKVKKYYSLKMDDKICLYAPTFRMNKQIEDYLGIYDIDYDKLLMDLKSKFQWNRKILIRLHPDISNINSLLFKTDSNIINATSYPDIQELLVASNFMITDYSSCIYDYALSKKPAITYAVDIEEYNRNERDFLLKLSETPFPIATNNQELHQIIMWFDSIKYEKIINKFYKKIGLKESGEACKGIVKIINKICQI